MPKFRIDYSVRKSIEFDAADITAAASQAMTRAMNREGAAAKVKIVQVLAEGEESALPDDRPSYQEYRAPDVR